MYEIFIFSVLCCLTFNIKKGYKGKKIKDKSKKEDKATVYDM